ncbi:MAG: hypothetical protein QF752_04660, partial [Planctomycetota bacterium]|nr:hypothetical protein [Planctomycetota bacterium]
MLAIQIQTQADSPAMNWLIGAILGSALVVTLLLFAFLLRGSSDNESQTKDIETAISPTPKNDP